MTVPTRAPSRREDCAIPLPRPSTRGCRLLKAYLKRPELAAVLLLALLSVVFESLSSGAFLSTQNLRAILDALSETGLVTIGVAVLMIGGEFDLSVGSVFALTPMVAATLMESDVPFLPAVVAGLLAAGLVGLLSGVVTLRLGIPSLIATLGALFLTRWVVTMISGEFPPLLPADVPAWVFTAFIGPGRLFRASLLWFVAIALLVGALLSLSRIGAWIRSIGSSSKAAMALGIPVRRVKMACFVLSAVLAGLAGLIHVLRVGSPLPSIGHGQAWQAIAAAVIGGVALTGGMGTVLGAVVGALLIGVIDNGLTLLGVDAGWFKFAVGALAILALVAHAWLRRAARRDRAVARASFTAN